MSLGILALGCVEQTEPPLVKPSEAGDRSHALRTTAVRVQRSANWVSTATLAATKLMDQRGHSYRSRSSVYALRGTQP